MDFRGASLLCKQIVFTRQLNASHYSCALVRSRFRIGIMQKWNPIRALVARSLAALSLLLATTGGSPVAPNAHSFQSQDEEKATAQGAWQGARGGGGSVRAVDGGRCVYVTLLAARQLGTEKIILCGPQPNTLDSWLRASALALQHCASASPRPLSPRSHSALQFPILLRFCSGW